jgi:hypothetical protein
LLFHNVQYDDEARGCWQRIIFGVIGLDNFILFLLLSKEEVKTLKVTERECYSGSSLIIQHVMKFCRQNVTLGKLLPSIAELKLVLKSKRTVSMNACRKKNLVSGKKHILFQSLHKIFQE